MRELGVLLLGLVVINECALNVLVYNIVFSHSHSRQTGLIADILAQAGHNVVSSCLLNLIFDQVNKISLNVNSCNQLYLDGTRPTRQQGRIQAKI